MFLSRALTFIPRRGGVAGRAFKSSTTAVTDTGKEDSKAEPTKSKLDDVRNNYTGVGYKADKHTRDVYLNPLLTPPPRSPSSPEEFANPSKLGHWFPIGFDYTDPLRDKYIFHELLFFTVSGGLVLLWLYAYGPDFRDREWARREAFLRTHKREALGLPLVDPNVVDPDRIVLPTEQELGNFFVTQ